MAIWLVLVPILAAAAAWATPSNRLRPWLLPAGGAVHLALVAQAVRAEEVTALQRWLQLDPPARVFLGTVSLLFFLCACYAPGYLAQRPERPNRVLCSCLLLALAMMTLALLSHHLGLMWVAMESMTLAMAPCVFFNHNARSLEATWKYLLVGSVGIALALLGSFFLAYSSLYTGMESTLLFDDLVAKAPKLSVPWLRAALVFLIVGYGTKVGFAPMHTWKPDCYGEAPGLIGALLAGGLTNVGFLGILRFTQIAHAAGQGEFVRDILMVLGLGSMAIGSVAMVRQRDIKRMLAYSSVEHMGVLAVGVAIGGAGTVGALWHVIHNGLTKGVLFLSVGNLHRACGSKNVGDLRGLLRRVPFSGAMFLLGFLAITGSPPFGPFASEFQIIVAGIAADRPWASVIFVGAMLVVFVGMGVSVVTACLGAAEGPAPESRFRDGVATGWPILVFLLLVLVLGVHNPPEIARWIEQAVAFLEPKG